MPSVERICRRDYDMDTQVRLVGRTLYVACELEGLVGIDLGLQKGALEKLEGAMISSTRVALSSDAEVRFMVTQAKDTRLGTTITLVRYFPDIKGIIYFRLSRTEFEDRLILETDTTIDGRGTAEWHDITMGEFIGRLTASRLQRQFTANPLVAVFLQIHRVTGEVKRRALQLHVDRAVGVEETNMLVAEILKAAVEETVADVLDKYDKSQSVERVVVKDDKDTLLLELDAQDLGGKRTGTWQDKVAESRKKTSENR